MNLFLSPYLFVVIFTNILLSQSVEIPNKMMNKSSLYRVPIFVYDVINLNSLAIEIKFDNNIVTVNDVIYNPVGILNSEDYNFDDNTIDGNNVKFHILSTSEDVFSGSGIIAQIEFSSIGNIGDRSEILIEDETEINGDFSIPKINGSIEIILDELTIIAQDIEMLGANHSITLGMCANCIDGWKFGEDEYDYPNPTSAYTNINFYHLDWFGTVDQNQNTCSDIEFSTDFRSQYSYSELVTWGILGSTFDLPPDKKITLKWDSEKLYSSSDNFKIYLYIGESDRYNMQENSSITIDQSDLPLNGDNLPNILVKLGTCADTGVTTTYYKDLDGDGLGSAISHEFCQGNQPNGWVLNNDDIALDCFSNIIDCAGICDGLLEYDCLDVCDGNAQVDNCGVCDNDLSNDCVQDCAGIWGGNAQVDNCGICDNDLSNDCVQDCAGTWGGIKVSDECGVCEGDNSSCVDCAGDPNGNKQQDQCGTCDSDPNNDCEQDCNGDWGGNAFLDVCGRCSGGNTGLDPISESNNCPQCPNSQVLGCDGECSENGSQKVFDKCEICGGSGQPSTGICDCNGDPNGNAVLDNCGVCDNNISNNCTQDCLGVWGGNAVLDNCGVCDNNSSNNCAQDCLGVWGGNAVLDNCGVCDNNSSNDCDKDCLGVWGGNAVVDNCGICDNNLSNDCQQDCNGDWGGEASLDNCAICIGGNTNNTPCQQDCNGDWGGEANIDNCEVCVGGNTNNTPCQQDCNGDWGGYAFEDGCGVCDLNNNNNNQCFDCFGIPNGNAELDNCNECIIEGESSTCSQGCDGVWNNIGLAKQYDDCGVCGGNSSSCTDCLGIVNGGAWENACEECVPVGDTSCSELDCASIANGSSYLDNCGICDSDPNNDCEQDCNGDWGGLAIIDINCETCIGGQTDLEPCIKDCAGVWGGSFIEDLCGVCDADTENDNECIDCNGTINGNAYLDNCGNCIEDSSDSSYECIMDCTGVWGGLYTPSFICDNGTLVCTPLDCDLSFVDQYSLPADFNINNIYPNPFNPKATINFSLSEVTKIKLNIFNVNGQKIAELKNELTLPGYYSVVWDGASYPSGIYFVVLNSNKSVITRKMMLLK